MPPILNIATNFASPILKFAKIAIFENPFMLPEMAAPAIVSDGDFRKAQQDGATVFEFPFSETRNDFATFVARRKMVVAVGSYRAPQPMSQKSFTGLGTGYLVGITSPSIIEGTDLLSYYEIYANVPKSHSEPGMATATVQTIVNIAPAPPPGDPPPAPVYVPIELSDNFDADFEYDYAIDRSQIPTRFKSQLKRYPGGIVNSLQFGLDFKRPPQDGRYLAGNSTTERYLGGIYVRQTIYVKPPPIKQWNGIA